MTLLLFVFAVDGKVAIVCAGIWNRDDLITYFKRCEDKCGEQLFSMRY